MIEFNPIRRYSANNILLHPWVSRKNFDLVPLIYIDYRRNRILKKKFISVKINFDCFSLLG